MQRVSLVAIGMTCSLLLAPLTFAAIPSTLPPEQTQGTVTYVSGGIGQEETQAFESAQRQYPLSLEFALQHAPRPIFTADVHVTITDKQGKSLLDTRSNGPFLLAKLPAGNYTVTAEQHGKTLTKTVHVATHKPAHLMFLWTA